MPPLDLAPGTLLTAVGPAASGKSTYAETTTVDGVICLDTLRQDIAGNAGNAGDAGDQSATPAAVTRQNALLEQHLTTGSTLFLDSTNVEVLVVRRPAASLRTTSGPGRSARLSRG